MSIQMIVVNHRFITNVHLSGSPVPDANGCSIHGLASFSEGTTYGLANVVDNRRVSRFHFIGALGYWVVSNAICGLTVVSL